MEGKGRPDGVSTRQLFPLLMIGTVFLDAVGTLFRVKGSVGEIYAATALKYGLEVPAQTIEANFRRAFRAAPPLAFPNLPPAQLIAAERDWWRARICESFGMAQNDHRADLLLGDLFQLFSGARSWDLYPEVPEVLVALKTAGCRLGVISNFDSRLPAVLDSLKIGSFMDVVIWSSRVGVEKPAPKIFLSALVAARVTADQAAHIGNELEADVHGALAAGMRGILLDRSGTAPQGTGIQVIHTLSQLPEIILRPS